MMPRSFLLLLLLFTGCLTMTGFVLHNEQLGREHASNSAMVVLLGDGRRLFANHFLAKADAYFHRGRYPSIFEVAEAEQQNFLRDSLVEDSAAAGHTQDDCPLCAEDPELATEHSHDPEKGHAHEEEHEQAAGHDLDGHGQPNADEHLHTEDCAHAVPPRGPDDWIARLAASFEPNEHVHLEQGGEKEMLPWIRLAVEMDPHNVDAYAIGGYWLRRMGKPGEAQSFLREGLRNNPDSFEIYFELGRLQESLDEDTRRALRFYQLSLEKWRQAAEEVNEPGTMALAQLLGRLGRIHENLGEYEAALRHYRLLKTISMNPDGVQRLIESVEARIGQPVTSPQPL